MVDIIKELCRSKGLSVSALEKELGFSNKAIYRWDENSPSVEKVKSVADYFGVSIDYIYGSTDKTKEDVLERAFNGRPEMRMLFSVAEDASAEDIQKAIDIIKIMKGSNNG